MGKGQLWPFAQSSPPGSHKAFRGTVEDLERVGIQLGTGGDRLVPLEPYINRTRSSSPHGKNDQLLDNQPRRTRRLRPARLLLPSVSGTGGGMPDGIGPRLDGVWTRARNLPHRQQKRPPANREPPGGGQCQFNPSASVARKHYDAQRLAL